MLSNSCNLLGTSPSVQFGTLAAGIYVRTVTLLDPNAVSRSMLFKFGIPTGYNRAVPARVVLCGHGSGETNGTGASDNNNTAQMAKAYPKWWQANSPTTVLIAPQMPLLGDGTGPWQHFMGQIYLQALRLVQREVNTNPKTILWSGYSAGAFVGWQMLYQYQTVFAGALLMSGRNWGPGTLETTGATDAAANTAVVAALRTPLHIHHGDADATVSDSYDIATVAAYTAAGVGSPPITYVNGAGQGHTDAYWDSVCADATVQTWLGAQSL